MIFDDLHDPRPPRPGMREFAIVAERAHAIRRRRIRHTMRWACALIVVACGAGIALTVGGRELQTTNDPPGPGPDAVVASAQVPLGESERIAQLPAVTLRQTVSLRSEAGAVELSQTADGRICASAGSGSTALACAPPHTGLVAVELTVEPSSESSSPSTVIAVDGSVDVNFLTVGVTCGRPGADPGIDLLVDVWLCDGLDVDRATAEAKAPDLVVITTTSER
jgi:hypothetical protein